MSKPDTTSLEYRRMEPHWALHDALLGGTAKMRGGFQAQADAQLAAKTQTVGTSWLPAHPGESMMRYQMRSRMSFLVNYYKRTLKQLVGHLLKDGVNTDEVDARLAEYLDDIDLCGNNINVFASQVVEKAIHKGGCFILCDSQGVNAENLGEQRQVGVRPYLVAYDLDDVPGVRFEVINGQEVITQARVKRCFVRPKDEFEDEAVEQILVYTPDTITPYEKIGGEWMMLEEMPNALGMVPLIPVSLNPVGPFEYRPCLESLAELNLEHFQIRSDYRSAVAHCNFAMLACSGFDPEKDPQVTVAPYTFLATSDAQGKYYYVEPTGNGANLSRTELERLEDQMGLFGLQYMAEKSDTATGRAIDADEATSELAEWGARVADALNNALYYMALRIGRTDGGTVEIKPPEPMKQAVVQEADVLLRARMAGEITRQEFRSELKRLGVAGENFDPDAEVESGEDWGTIPASDEPTPSQQQQDEINRAALRVLNGG